MTTPSTTNHSATTSSDLCQARDVMGEAMYEEFDDWDQRLGRPDEHPDPRSPDGLPSSWVLIAHRVFMVDDHTEALLGLVRRDAGGWLVIKHVTSRRGNTTGTARPRRTHLGAVGAYATSVADLILLIQERHHLHWIEHKLRAMITDAYNPDDPVEAGERTLVALGGPMLLIPRSWESQ